MDIITGRILKLNNWSDGKIIGLAKAVATQLIEQGLNRETVLAQSELVDMLGKFTPRIVRMAGESGDN
jgi:hypothetical protein